MTAILHYFHDPMCSWCYAFQPVWQEIKQELPAGLVPLYVLGGLAEDDDEAMPLSLQRSIQEHWQRIEQLVPGTRFNFEFWTRCMPRRSTWPACRAVIAAGGQGDEMGEAMIGAIQRAYYREARNPSDSVTHLELAAELGLDVGRFQADLESAATQQELRRQLRLTRAFGVQGFPALVLGTADENLQLPIDYQRADAVLAAIRQAL